MQLLNLDSKITKDFMNSFFNSINDITSELFIIFKELKNKIFTLPASRYLDLLATLDKDVTRKDLLFYFVVY